jgi:diguanylate cyclase (GGDEF)-like protein
VSPDTPRALKNLQRTLLVSSREQPSRVELEELAANVQRVGLVITVRWVLVAVLVLFSLAAASVYSVDPHVRGFVGNLFVPAIALAFVLVYNTFFQLTYRRFANFAPFNVLQLVLDILTATVIMQYSAGVYSWFDSMYLLFILEGALILPKRWQVAAVAVTAIVCYGAVIFGQFFNILQTPTIPFIDGSLAHNGTYAAVRFLWGATMMAGAGAVANLIVTSYRREERAIAEDSLLDHETGLYNRAHFFRMASRELERATRHGKALSVLLVDVDDFDRFNRILGFEEADVVLSDFAAELREAALELGAADDADLATIFRFAGEEFAIIMPHDVSARDALREAAPRAQRLAERIRNRAHLVRRGELRVTVSVGVATYPDDGATVEDLVDRADGAIAAGLAGGGDRAVSAGQLAKEIREEESAAETEAAKAPADEGDEWDLDV